MPSISADFEEKSFEGAANAELSADWGRTHTPGQVEEAILGYDTSSVPGQTARQVLKQVAGIEIPPATWLTPNWWLRCAARPEASTLPSRFASLLLQYKRPATWFGATAPLFAAYGGPYFRFELRTAQHKTLVRLDEALRDEALVRYAAPCTAQRVELEQWQMDRRVLHNTNFVSPRRIGLRHKAWTYTGPGQVGYRNEYSGENDAVRSESVEEVVGTLADRPQSPRLNQHLSTMLQRLGGAAADAQIDAVASELAGTESITAIAAVVRLWLLGLEFGDAGLSWWFRQV